MEQQSKRPLVSVVMPLYNAENYVGEAIRSVQSQTCGDWELLVIDDGSRDDSLKIAQRLAAEDPRIAVHANPRNMGVAGTRNRGLDLARGDWVAFLDSDDLWRRDKLEKQLRLAHRTGAKMIYTSYTLFRDGPSTRSDYVVPERITYESMLRENAVGCSTVLIRRDALAGHRFSPEIYHEDYALWLELLRTGCEAAGCTETLVDWRICPGSRSFRKWAAGRNRWYIYRKVEKLPVGRSARAFAAYAVRGLAKHKRI